MPTDKLLTAAELAEAVPFPSEATVNRLRRKKKIPCVKIGYRTIRYDLERVRTALGKLEVTAI